MSHKRTLTIQIHPDSNGHDELTTRQARLQEIVHGELLLQCGAESCGQVFAPTLEEPASDPVEPWADRMASRALEAGWSVGKDGHARCPMHPDGESQT
ncbi:hypothetical protein CDL60_19190 [Roseateles noduli]|nr:hypothetical protein CDL60_19190 [Roseateles noduli]